MIRSAAVSVIAVVMCLLGASSALGAPLIGQIDTFEDGTTQGWTVNLLGMGVHPAPPSNDTGGQGGADDNFLLLTSTGVSGPGSKLSVANLDSRWTGDFVAAGITAITMDVINLGPADLFLRFGFEDPTMGPPENIAFTDAVVVPTGSGWTSIEFLVSPAYLTAALGSVNLALTNTTAVRLYHSNVPGFPNPVMPIPSIATQLGVDNVSATVAAVPEPASLALFGLAVAALGVRRRHTS